MIQSEIELAQKLNLLNELFVEIKQFKEANPVFKGGYYHNNIGSILNAYREGDIEFESAIEAVSRAAQPNLSKLYRPF